MKRHLLLAALAVVAGGVRLRGEPQPAPTPLQEVLSRAPALADPSTFATPPALESDLPPPPAVTLPGEVPEDEADPVAAAEGGVSTLIVGAPADQEAAMLNADAQLGAPGLPPRLPLSPPLVLGATTTPNPAAVAVAAAPKEANLPFPPLPPSASGAVVWKPSETGAIKADAKGKTPGKKPLGPVIPQMSGQLPPCPKAPLGINQMKLDEIKIKPGQVPVPISGTGKVYMSANNESVIEFPGLRVRQGAGYEEYLYSKPNKPMRIVYTPRAVVYQGYDKQNKPVTIYETPTEIIQHGVKGVAHVRRGKDHNEVTYNWCSPRVQTFTTKLGNIYKTDNGMFFHGKTGTAEYTDKGVVYHGQGGITYTKKSGEVLQWTTSGLTRFAPGGAIYFTAKGTKKPQRLALTQVALEKWLRKNS
mmetsp:Transcript_32079/g.70290  ORF Transcript_32079/g.70290 Transcript_32079/m.70290 type:complete len:417 (+) Transcript_32079:171-1421(+)